jgi:peptidoglycan lytic transglycosylase D
MSLLITGLTGFSISRNLNVNEREIEEKLVEARIESSVIVMPELIASADTFEFPVSESLRPNIDFWKKVFGEYNSNTYILHDKKHPEIVYEVLNFNDLQFSVEAGLLSKQEAASIRYTKLRLVKQRYNRILNRLEARKKEFLFTREEKRLRELLAEVDEDPSFSQAAARLHYQRGQADLFARAYHTAEPYLIEMEQLFVDRGLPWELTRIAFVESLFETDAVSHAGATGVWQFIERTGHKFLTISSALDERLDPLFATEAAAELLLENHSITGSWPLAITAYNHGPGGILRAVRSVGSSDLGKIVENYRGSRFGYASANYYTEFIAVLELEREGNIPQVYRYDQVIAKQGGEKEIVLTDVRIENPIFMRDLAALARIEPEMLQQLNPALLSPVIDGEQPLPTGYTLRLPEHNYWETVISLASLPEYIANNESDS